MKVFKTVVDGAIKPMVNVPGWLGYSQLKDNTFSLIEWLKVAFMPQKATRKETFEQAMKRLNLTEKDIQSRQKAYKQQTIFFLFIAIFVFIYSMYLLFNAHILTTLLALLVFMLVLTRAFVSNFWYFQIKHRKLGCTVKDWYHGHIQEESHQ